MNGAIRGLIRRGSGDWLGTLLLTVIVLATWELLVRGFRVEPYVAPPPSSVGIVFVAKAPILIRHGTITLIEALLGLGIATVVGIAAALLLHSIPVLHRVAQPIISGFQSFPKEGIAPLLLIWFGFGMPSKVVMASSIAFFPVFLAMLKGLKSVPDDVVFVYRSLRASPAQTLVHVRIPYSLPFVMSGIRVASTLSIVGAVIGEFIGSSAGLGHLILVANSQFAVDLVFACLFALAVMGMTIDLILRGVEQLLIPWHESITELQDLSHYDVEKS